MTYSVYLIIYFIIHSFLASRMAKKAATVLFPERYYRIVYNIMAIILLIPVALMYKNAVDKEMIFEAVVWTSGVGVVVLIIGLFFLWKSLKGYDGREFSGLKQLKQKEEINKNRREELSVKGLNAHVRHPLYFASLLIIWGVFVVIPNNYVLMTAIIATIYLFPGIYLEEQKLIAEFGQSYRAYKKNVPMLIPKIGIVSELWK